MRSQETVKSDLAGDGKRDRHRGIASYPGRPHKAIPVENRTHFQRGPEGPHAPHAIEANRLSNDLILQTAVSI